MRMYGMVWKRGTEGHGDLDTSAVGSPHRGTDVAAKQGSGSLHVVAITYTSESCHWSASLPHRKARRTFPKPAVQL